MRSDFRSTSQPIDRWSAEKVQKRAINEHHDGRYWESNRLNYYYKIEYLSFFVRTMIWLFASRLTMGIVQRFAEERNPENGPGRGPMEIAESMRKPDKGDGSYRVPIFGPNRIDQKRRSCFSSTHFDFIPSLHLCFHRISSVSTWHFFLLMCRLRLLFCYIWFIIESIIPVN